MLRNKQALNWVTGAGLLAILLAEFYLDLTGVSLHQWLGLALSALIGYHVAAHWSWVKAVAARFFQGTSAQARRYFLLDAGLALGFGLILVSGLAISTWLDLPLGNYEFWKDLHVVCSVATLLAVVGKIGLHWKWIVKTAWRALHSPGRAAREPALAGAGISRRHFLSLMGVVSLAALVAIDKAVFEDASLPEGTGAAPAASDPAQPPSASPSSGATQPATLAPTSTAQPATPLTDDASSGSAATGSCVVRCNRRCSYPGHCRRYTDQNGNNLCDLGECA